MPGRTLRRLLERVVRKLEDLRIRQVRVIVPAHEVGTGMQGSGSD